MGCTGVEITTIRIDVQCKVVHNFHGTEHITYIIYWDWIMRSRFFYTDKNYEQKRHSRSRKSEKRKVILGIQKKKEG